MGGRAIPKAEAIAEVYRGFLDGRSADVETVRGWIGAVVHGGNWRFGDAEAVSQDALLTVFKLADAGKIRDGGGFQKLVYTVAKRTCVDVYHRERRRRQHETSALPAEPADDADTAQDKVERRERIELLTYVLQHLSPACRELWDQVYRQKLPAARVARRLGITPNNVRVRVHRCALRAREIYRRFAEGE